MTVILLWPAIEADAKTFPPAFSPSRVSRANFEQGHIEHKTAGMILYGLQTASYNLRNTKFEADPQKIVVDPANVGETLMDSLLWDNSHFPDEEENDGEDDGEEEDQEEVQEEDSDNDSSETNVGHPLLLRDSTEEEDSTEIDSPKTNSKGRPQPQENDWSDLRNQIATIVKKSAQNGAFAKATNTARRST